MSPRSMRASIQTSDQGKLGTTFKHSIPIGEQYSLTLQNSYSVTQTSAHR